MSTQQNGLVAGNRQNEAGGATGKSRSRFPLSYTFLETERFAEYTPFFVQEAVSGDRLPLHSNHEVQTYTLKSPVLQSLLKKKDYFAVPMQAILPLNWEKFYTNPNIGEDVPDDVGCGVVGFWNNVRSHFIEDFTAVRAFFNDTGNSISSRFMNLVKFLIFYEKFYSAGSLFESLGISGHNYFRCIQSDDTGNHVLFFDEIFDSVFSYIQSELSTSQRKYIYFTIGDTSYVVQGSSEPNFPQARVSVTLREALEIWRDDLTFTEFSCGNFVDVAYTPIKTFLSSLTLNMPTTDSPLNLSRLWAYQLVCAHFYSNDHVDFIYSAELYRQYIWQLFRNFSAAFLGSEILDIGFSVNGFNYEYDALSAFVCNTFISFWDLTSPDFVAYWTSLLSFKRSLRFMDYFTGSRTYPLAVGDTAVDVNNGQVSIIDLSQKSMLTKFLQAVNRSGRKFGAYMQELFGIVPKYDYHNPMYLAHTSDVVGAQETDNTAEAQVTDAIAVTSRLRASSSRYAFEFTPDRDSIIIGVSYYDLPRVYSRATERQNFYVDRFDMFNPYMQFIGDQSISNAELGTSVPDSTPFSYTNRHMEYKQRYNQCAGGFCIPSTGLDHWIFIADELRRQGVRHISPSFIRSFNSELDRFYQSLTGYSLGTYFHFIVRYDNRMDASRPMAFNPSINI